MKYKNNAGSVKFLLTVLLLDELRDVTIKNFVMLSFYYEILPKYRLKKYANGNCVMEILIRFSQTEKILFGLLGKKVIIKDVWVNEDDILFNENWNMKIEEYDCASD